MINVIFECINLFLIQMTTSLKGMNQNVNIVFELFQSPWQGGIIQFLWIIMVIFAVLNISIRFLKEIRLLITLCRGSLRVTDLMNLSDEVLENSYLLEWLSGWILFLIHALIGLFLFFWFFLSATSLNVSLYLLNFRLYI